MPRVSPHCMTYVVASSEPQYALNLSYVTVHVVRIESHHSSPRNFIITSALELDETKAMSERIRQ